MTAGPLFPDFARLSEQVKSLEPPSEGLLTFETLSCFRRARLLRRVGGKTSLFPPILVIWSLINRPSILNLLPHVSFVRDAERAGLSVYLLDWGDWDAEEAGRLDAERLLGYLQWARKEVLLAQESSSLDLLGICQGAHMACLSALQNSENIRRLIMVAAPLYQPPSLWPHLDLKPETLDRCKRSVFFDGALLFLAFSSMQNSPSKYKQLWNSAQTPKGLEYFMALERWAYDSPDVPSLWMHDFITQVYHQNVWGGRGYLLEGRRYRLSQLRRPILNVYGLRDRLVHPESSRRIGPLCASVDYQERALDTGHLGMWLSAEHRERLIQALVQGPRAL